ncbi:DUF4123 domain-containing protein [Chitinimonas sp. BJB300]|uniref:DUF4123 domain-containing protein n=1 Tax=Chitinimonas sp. BJB300 TaxID=1559339 RepID=UPI000C1163DD|nr:DUF4123 domain-containing protein [Chitinimonas sp. BJB300]PHV11929.1 hypothetical protein CSQ89_08380 [Chitinimonas sp. BJB300]TSJ84477.1 DUF4123 domain-containing protein [Chitinimonas sp. BJB300]
MHIDAFPTHLAEAITGKLQHELTDQPQRQVYALVDHLFRSDQVGQQVLNVKRWPYINLLDHLAGAKDPQSLLLLALPDNPDALSAAVAALCKVCSGLPMLSFMVSRASLSELASHLRAYTEVKLLPDDEAYVLRLGDNRIQAAYLACLDATQRAALLAPMVTWIRIRRDAQWEETRGGDVPKTEPQSLPLLEAPQWEALFAAGWADDVLFQVKEAKPDIWRDHMPSQQYATVTRWLREAHQAGHLTPEDQLNYCLDLAST